MQPNKRSGYRIALSLGVMLAIVGGLWLAVVPRGPSSVQVGETVIDPRAVYDPVRAGEELPAGFRQLLGRDAIHPVYMPTFVAAEEAGWDDETLVIGVARGTEAKAYPVSFLNHREMVNDSIGGTPVLVTW